jgi:hypothetical protein
LGEVEKWVGHIGQQLDGIIAKLAMGVAGLLSGLFLLALPIILIFGLTWVSMIVSPWLAFFGNLTNFGKAIPNWGDDTKVSFSRLAALVS